MAEHGLDVSHIRAAFEHERGHGVAEQMTGAFFADTGCLDVVLGQPGRRERGAVGGEEQPVVIGHGRPTRPHINQISSHLGECPLTNRNHAVFAAFALTNEDRVPVEIDIEQLQVR